MREEDYMNSSPTKTKRPVNSAYNGIPVFYCKDCLSLKIMRMGDTDEMCYCDDCGCTDFGETHIRTWDKLYQLRYGHSYINNEQYDTEEREDTRAFL